jgi:hypothetical protein
MKIILILICSAAGAVAQSGPQGKIRFDWRPASERSVWENCALGSPPACKNLADSQDASGLESIKRACESNDPTACLGYGYILYGTMDWEASIRYLKKYDLLQRASKKVGPTFDFPKLEAYVRRYRACKADPKVCSAYSGPGGELCGQKLKLTFPAYADRYAVKDAKAVSLSSGFDGFICVYESRKIWETIIGADNFFRGNRTSNEFSHYFNNDGRDVLKLGLNQDSGPVFGSIVASGHSLLTERIDGGPKTVYSPCRNMDTLIPFSCPEGLDFLAAARAHLPKISGLRQTALEEIAGGYAAQFSTSSGANYLLIVSTDSRNQSGGWLFGKAPKGVRFGGEIVASKNGKFLSLLHSSNDLGEDAYTAASLLRLRNGEWTWEELFSVSGMMNYHAAEQTVTANWDSSMDFDYSPGARVSPSVGFAGTCSKETFSGMDFGNKISLKWDVRDLDRVVMTQCDEKAPEISESAVPPACRYTGLPEEKRIIKVDGKDRCTALVDCQNGRLTVTYCAPVEGACPEKADVCYNDQSVAAPAEPGYEAFCLRSPGSWLEYIPNCSPQGRISR